MNREDILFRQLVALNANLKKLIDAIKTEKSFTYEDVYDEEFWLNIEWDEIDLWGVIAGTLKEDGKPELIQECINEVLKVDKLRDKLDTIEKYCDIEVRLTIKESGFADQCECDRCRKERGEIIDE